MTDLYDDNLLFSDLEDIHIDPYLARLMGQTQELEAFLNAPDRENDELSKLTVADITNETLAKLIAECPYYLQPVEVTGKIIRPIWDELAEEYTFIEVELRDEPMISSGFNVVKMKRGEDGEDEFVVGHSFFVERSDARQTGIDLIDEVKHLHAFAPIGKVDIEYKKGIEETIASLEAAVPDILNEIDVLICNAENESEALKKLGKMVIPSSRDIPTSVLRDLLYYVQHMLDFDTSAPYEIVVHGFLQTDKIGEDGFNHLKYFSDRPGVILAMPQSVALGKRIYKENGELKKTDDWYWLLNLEALGITPHDPTETYQVAARDIRTIHSVRQVVYAT